MANRRLNRQSRQARFSRYTGGPDPLAAPVDVRGALDAVGDDVMAGTSPEQALKEYLRREGLDDLARQVAERRRELTADNNLGGTLREIRELLDKAVLAERGELARDIDLDDTSRALAEMQLENLPPSPAAAVSELAGYDWHSAAAQEHFREIQDLLGRDMLDQRFAGMKQALENATDADRAATQEMLGDLNRLLDAHQRGDFTPEEMQQQFDDFMARHGEHFPENPRTIDELLDTLADRAAAGQRLRNSLTREQREELDALAQQAFGSPDLLDSLRHLDGHLQSLRPDENWTGSPEPGDAERFSGFAGLNSISENADLDDLLEQLSQSYPGSTLGDIDLDALTRLLGDDGAAAAETLKHLRDLDAALRNSGTLRRGVDGSLQLSPKAMRMLGRSLLRDAADRLSGRVGNRDLRSGGAGGEISGSTRPWEFGDTAPWDVTRTVNNAVLRTVSDGGGVGSTAAGVRLEIGDVEVQDTEARTRACVALLVDTSFSMAMEGRWVPMKRTALALHTLISTRFRGDELELVTFGRQAWATDIGELTSREAEWEQGTNLHHALMLANRHFRRHPDAQPVLLVVTDGEPTAHLQPDGHAFFDYPPHPLTVAHAVEELDEATRLGAQTTFFRLGDDPGLARFIDSVARRAGGSVVAPDLDDLGAAVVGSYLGARQRRRN